MKNAGTSLPSTVAPENAGFRLYSTVEIAALTGVSRRFFENVRVRGDGPRYTKLGSCVRYRMDDVLAWLEGNARTSTSAEPTA